MALRAQPKKSNNFLLCFKSPVKIYSGSTGRQLLIVSPQKGHCFTQNGQWPQNPVTFSFTLTTITTSDCVVPENIHTPTTEGIGNSRGVGGGQWLRKFQRGGGVNDWISFQRVNFMSDIVVQNSNLPI